MASYNKRISDQSKVKFNPINRELEDSENSELDSRVDNLEENILGSKTATGNPITVTDAAPVNAVNLSINLEPIQAGSGTPSPDNIRPISGRTEEVITQKDNPTNPTVTKTYTIQLGDTIYGGELDVITGKFTVTHELWSKNTSTMDNTENFPGWVHSGIKELVGNGLDMLMENQIMNIGTEYGANTQEQYDILYLPPDTYGKTQTEWKALAQDIEIAVELAEPFTIPLTPLQIKMLENTNTLYTDYEGDTITIEYQPNNAIGDVLGEVNDIYDPIIDDIYNKIGSLDTRVTALEKS